MGQQWYVRRGERTAGPFTSHDLRAWAADGRLSAADEVSPDRKRWAAAGKVKGLHFPAPDPPKLTETTGVVVVTPVAAETVADVVVVPGYEVRAVLGSGGCGVVYRARQLRLDREVALKTVQLQSGPADVLLSRFEREAVALAKFQHPNIVNVFDYGHHDGRVYMAMELLDGEDLERRIKRAGPLDERTAWAIARQTAAALGHAAKAGITHRDVKPANLFLVRSPTGFGLPEDLPMVKVTDFGLAIANTADLGADGGRLTRAGVVLGTPLYMAPEQFARSDVDHRADIYALGATVFHALTGRPPFDGVTVWDVMTKKGGPPPDLGGGTAETARLVADMLAPDPDRRVADYAELIRRIDELPLPPLGAGGRASPSWWDTSTVWSDGGRKGLGAGRSIPRRWLIRGAVGLAVLVSGVLLAAGLSGSGPGPARGPAPEMATAGSPEVLSDRANFASWDVEGKYAYEKDGEGVEVLTTSGAIRWSYRPTGADRLSVGFDPFRAETVDLLFAGTYGLRVSRKDGVAAGEFSPDGTFRPLTPVVPYPSADAREGLVPYLSADFQRVGDRWDVWFDHKPLGGVITGGAAGGQFRVRTDGRAVRVERVELERLRPAE